MRPSQKTNGADARTAPHHNRRDGCNNQQPENMQAFKLDTLPVSPNSPQKQRTPVPEKHQQGNRGAQMQHDQKRKERHIVQIVIPVQQRWQNNGMPQTTDREKLCRALQQRHDKCLHVRHMRLYPHYSFLIDVLAPCPRWLQGFRPALITGREQVAIKEGKNMMRQSRTGAWIFSGAVLLAAAGFASYALGTQKAPGGNGYELSARFVSANGLTRGADVELAGVRVGRVSSITLGPPARWHLCAFGSPRHCGYHRTARSALAVPRWHRKTRL